MRAAGAVRRGSNRGGRRLGPGTGRRCAGRSRPPAPARRWSSCTRSRRCPPAGRSLPPGRRPSRGPGRRVRSTPSCTPPASARRCAAGVRRSSPANAGRRAAAPDSRPPDGCRSRRRVRGTRASSRRGFPACRRRRSARAGCLPARRAYRPCRAPGRCRRRAPTRRAAGRCRRSAADTRGSRPRSVRARRHRAGIGDGGRRR